MFLRNAIPIIALAAIALVGSCKTPQSELQSLPTTAEEKTFQVVTYNTGLLEVQRIDLVPCVKGRIAPQVRDVFTKAVDTTQPFVIALQEVWVEEAYNAYRQVAIDEGYEIYPISFRGVDGNGQVLISNMTVVGTGFKGFSGDGATARGIRTLTVEFESRDIVIANVHTGYSTSKEFTKKHRRHFEEVRDFMIAQSDQDRTVIAMGDYNAGPDLHFRREKYDPVEEIWHGSLMPNMLSANMRLISQLEEKTWAEGSNKLIHLESVPIMWHNIFATPSHSFGWEELNSTLDHIFASPEIKSYSSKVVMDHLAELPERCEKYYERDKKGHLSDHFGVRATVGLHSVPAP